MLGTARAKMNDQSKMVKQYFPTAESRRRASSELIRDAEAILAKYDPDLVAEILRRREAGESFRQIAESLNNNPDVAAIGMQLAVIRQARIIKSGG
jgi:hypothetical protein